MNNLIIGEKIKLRPSNTYDKRKIFEWLTNSNLTNQMMGEPFYPDAKIPTWEEFDNAYPNYYFDGSEPFEGRCFIILENENEAGQIHYNAINTLQKCTDLDIWLSDLKYTGRGIGTEALVLLCNYLYERFNCEQIRICPSKRNKKAIRSFEKAGFVMAETELDEQEKDYIDNVILIKKKNK